jgi:hypothetical protein
MVQAIQISRQRSLAKTIERKIQDTILATPFVSDVFRYHWKFLSRIGACRGVYGPRIVGELIILWNRDYPILVRLATCLNEGTQILNLDGNAGAEYFTYRTGRSFPSGASLARLGYHTRSSS